MLAKRRSRPIRFSTLQSGRQAGSAPAPPTTAAIINSTGARRIIERHHAHNRAAGSTAAGAGNGTSSQHAAPSPSSATRPARKRPGRRRGGWKHHQGGAAPLTRDALEMIVTFRGQRPLDLAGQHKPGQQRPPRDGLQYGAARIAPARSSRSALARRSAAPGWSPSASHSVAVLRASSASTTAAPRGFLSGTTDVVQQVIDQAAVSLHGAPLGTLRRHFPASRAAERAARRIRSTTAPRPAIAASWQIVATATP